MTFTIKLFLSASTACLAVGYAARHRANGLHRRLMTVGIALAWGGAAVLVAGRGGLGLPLHPAYWLSDLTGSPRAVVILVAVQQAFGGLALLVLVAQGVLGRLRHPLHRPVSRVALPLWLLVWVSAMVGYV